jgi:hypothetical protein
MEKKLIFLFTLTIVLSLFPMAIAATEYSPLQGQVSQELDDYLQGQGDSNLMLTNNLSSLRNLVASFTFIFLIIAVIEVVLKGFAMWKAAKKDQKVWFWLILILNTMGILPLIYLIIYRDKKKKQKKD